MRLSSCGGFIRLIQINVLDSTQIEYECSLHGQTADLFTTIADRKLNVLNFSEYNHTLSSGTVINSWDTSIIKNATPQAFSYGEGYMYALIDKGYSSVRNITRFDVPSMTPCLYAKTIVDKIFTNAGYSYTNDSFFNNARFKRLVIPPPNGLLVESSVLESRRFKAGRSSTQTLQLNDTLIFNVDSGGNFYDNGNNFNTTTGAYIVPVGGNYVFEPYLELNLTILNPSIINTFFKSESEYMSITN